MAIFVSHKVSKIVNLLSPDRFFQPQYSPLTGALPRTSLWELTTLSRLPSRLGRGTPLPIPLVAFGISILGASLLDAFSVSNRAKPASALLAFLF